MAGSASDLSQSQAEAGHWSGGGEGVRAALLVPAKGQQIVAPAPGRAAGTRYGANRAVPAPQSSPLPPGGHGECPTPATTVQSGAERGGQWSSRCSRRSTKRPLQQLGSRRALERGTIIFLFPRLGTD